MGEWCMDPHFLDLDTSWRWVVSFTPCRFTPGVKASGTHYIGGWVDPRACLDEVEKRYFLTLPGLELRPLGRAARSQSLYRLSYPGSWVRRIARRNGKVVAAALCERGRMTHLTIYLRIYSPCEPWPLFQFLNLYTVGRTPWTGDQPVEKSLSTHRTT
jgi:hypothetical protein